MIKALWSPVVLTRTGSPALAQQTVRILTPPPHRYLPRLIPRRWSPRSGRLCRGLAGYGSLATCPGLRSGNTEATFCTAEDVARLSRPALR